MSIIINTERYETLYCVTFWYQKLVIFGKTVWYHELTINTAFAAFINLGYRDSLSKKDSVIYLKKKEGMLNYFCLNNTV